MKKFTLKQLENAHFSFIETLDPSHQSRNLIWIHISKYKFSRNYRSEKAHLE